MSIDQRFLNRLKFNFLTDRRVDRRCCLCYLRPKLTVVDVSYCKYRRVVPINEIPSCDRLKPSCIVWRDGAGGRVSSLELKYDSR